MIAAEGEQKASHALKEAAAVIQESPSALQVPISFLSMLKKVLVWLHWHWHSRVDGYELLY